MDHLTSGDLTVAVESSPPETIRCVWRGKSNHRHPAKVLSPFFGDVLGVAADGGVGIEMHFEELDQLNSSTITALIQLIQEARSRGVKLSMCYDDKLKWQKLSFDALRVFERDDGLFDLRAV